MYYCWHTGCVFSAIYRSWRSDCPPQATGTPIIWLEQPNVATSLQNISQQCYSICNTPINLEVCFGILNKERCRQYVLTDWYYTQHRWLIPQCLSAPTAHYDICSKVNHTSAGRRTPTENHITLHTQPQIEQHELWFKNTFVCVCVWARACACACKGKGHPMKSLHSIDGRQMYAPAHLLWGGGWSAPCQSHITPQKLSVPTVQETGVCIYLLMSKIIILWRIKLARLRQMYHFLRMPQTTTNVSFAQDATNNHKSYT